MSSRAALDDLTRPAYKDVSAKAHSGHIAHLSSKSEAERSHIDTLLVGGSYFERLKGGVMVVDGSNKKAPVHRERWPSAPSNVFNAGVSGDRLENMLWRCTSFEFTDKPENENKEPLFDICSNIRQVILFAGINNAFFAPQSQCGEFMTGMENFISRAYEHHRMQRLQRVVVYGLPSRESIQNQSGEPIWRKCMMEYNNALRAMCQRQVIEHNREVLYCDALVSFKVADGDFGEDPLHLSDQGYEKWLPVLKKQCNISHNSPLLNISSLKPHLIDNFRGPIPLDIIRESKTSKIGDNWTSDGESVSIRTLCGSIWGTHESRKNSNYPYDYAVSNIFRMKDLSAVTDFKEFSMDLEYSPCVHGAQAGILLYLDDLNWIKLVIEGDMKEGKVVAVLAIQLEGLERILFNKSEPWEKANCSNKYSLKIEIDEAIREKIEAERAGERTTNGAELKSIRGYVAIKTIDAEHSFLFNADSSSSSGGVSGACAGETVLDFSNYAPVSFIKASDLQRFQPAFMTNGGDSQKDWSEELFSEFSKFSEISLK